MQTTEASVARLADVCLGIRVHPSRAVSHIQNQAVAKDCFVAARVQEFAVGRADVREQWAQKQLDGKALVMALAEKENSIRNTPLPADENAIHAEMEELEQMSFEAAKVLLTCLIDCLLACAYLLDFWLS